MTTEATLTVSQEFLDPSKVVDDLKTFSSNLTKFIGGFRERKVNQFTPLSTRPLKAFFDVPYTATRPWGVQVPVGLVSTFLEYQASLATAVDVCARLDSEILTPFQSWLALKLANPETLNSMRQERVLNDFTPHRLETLGAELDKHFDIRKGIAKRPYGEVVKRHKDLQTAIETQNELNNTFMATKQRDILNQVMTISDMLEKLYQRIREDETSYEISEASFKALGELTHALAREVEFYSTIGFRLQSMTAALEATTERLKTLAKKQ